MGAHCGLPRPPAPPPAATSRVGGLACAWLALTLAVAFAFLTLTTGLRAGADIAVQIEHSAALGQAGWGASTNDADDRWKL